MNDIATRPGQEPPADNAAAAFEALRRQLALLHAAVEGFAARQDVIAARDYAPDLARIVDLQNRMVSAINTLGSKPAMALTPESMAAEIEKAAVTARRADHEALADAARQQVAVAWELNGMIGRVRMEADQLDAQIWSWLFGAGTVLVLLILPQLIAALKG
jgi:hypothetical protein